MAPQRTLLLLALLCSFTFSLFLSARSRPSPEETSILDVSAALEQAQQVLSVRPQAFEASAEESAAAAAISALSPNATFSVQLSSRHAIYGSNYKKYKNLVRDRLFRDSARVDSLNTKLQLSLHAINRSTLKPLAEQLQPEDLSGPVTSGASQGSGEYFCRIGVGTPPKVLSLVVDTGSDVNWLQCQPCADCYRQADAVFDPSSSSSYKPLTCGTQQCSALEVSACRGDRCLYQVSYGDGSFTVGDFVTESLSFGNSGKVDSVALGCGHDNEGLFVGAAGLLGLGGGALSLPTQIKATSFSYCLVDRDSSATSTLEFNTVPPADSVVTKLLSDPRTRTFYFVKLSGLDVGGQAVSIPDSTFQFDAAAGSGVIVDSGTAVTRLQTAAYEALRDAFVRMTPNLKRTTSVALFDTCYDLSQLESVKIPTVSLNFDGKKVALLAKNYMVPVDSEGTFCFAFAPTDSSMSIIGNVQQQGIRVFFNLADSTVGFSPNKC